MKDFDSILTGKAEPFKLGEREWRPVFPVKIRDWNDWRDRTSGLFARPRKKSTEMQELLVEVIVGTDAMVKAGIYREPPTDRHWAPMIDHDLDDRAKFAEIAAFTTRDVLIAVVDYLIGQMVILDDEDKDDADPKDRPGEQTSS